MHLSFPTNLYIFYYIILILTIYASFVLFLSSQLGLMTRTRPRRLHLRVSLHSAAFNCGDILPQTMIVTVCMHIHTHTHTSQCSNERSDMTIHTNAHTSLTQIHTHSQTHEHTHTQARTTFTHTHVHACIICLPIYCLKLHVFLLLIFFFLLLQLLFGSLQSMFADSGRRSVVSTTSATPSTNHSCRVFIRPSRHR